MIFQAGFVNLFFKSEIFTSMSTSTGHWAISSDQGPHVDAAAG
jgi:hypothetical protein